MGEELEGLMEEDPQTENRATETGGGAQKRLWWGEMTTSMIDGKLQRQAAAQIRAAHAPGMKKDV